MNYECRITVLETKAFPELQKKYLEDVTGIATDDETEE